MAKETRAAVRKHVEVETYVSHGISVMVEIDYDAGNISLLQGRGKAKNWVFAGRGPEYMDGWRNILHAMEYAIGEAEKKLVKAIAVQDSEEARRDMKLARAIHSRD